MEGDVELSVPLLTAMSIQPPAPVVPASESVYDPVPPAGRTAGPLSVTVTALDALVPWQLPPPVTLAPHPAVGLFFMVCPVLPAELA